MAGSDGCNLFTAPVRREVTPLSIGTPMATRKRCNGAGVVEQERQCLAALPTAASLRLEGEPLALSSPSPTTR